MNEIAASMASCQIQKASNEIDTEKTVVKGSRVIGIADEDDIIRVAFMDPLCTASINVKGMRVAISSFKKLIPQKKNCCHFW